jgi:hypothetical protein
MVVNIAHCRTFKRSPERVLGGAKNVPPTKADAGSITPAPDGT